MPDNAPPDLVASTGINDPSSPWNGLLQSALTDATQIGSSALTTALAGQTPVNQATGGAGLPINPASSAGSATPAATPKPASSHLTLWIIGGLVAVVIGIFYFSKRS